jgi:hypothetical protein
MDLLAQPTKRYVIFIYIKCFIDFIVDSDLNGAFEVFNCALLRLQSQSPTGHHPTAEIEPECSFSSIYLSPPATRPHSSATSTGTGHDEERVPLLVIFTSFLNAPRVWVDKGEVGSSERTPKEIR